jgi:hypothetical protein
MSPTARSEQFGNYAGRHLAAMRRSISRDQFFAGLYILGCANGLLGRFLLVTTADGALGLFSVEISIFVWYACFVAISALLSAETDQIRPADLGVAALFLVLVTLPIFSLSWVAITGLSLYIVVFARGNDERTRGAVTLLALTVPMLWSRILFQFFAGPILKIDASLAAFLLNTERVGNMVGFRDGSGFMVVLPACSSFSNMALALLGWISISQWMKHRWSLMDIFWSLLACLSVIVINVTRISLMGISRQYFEVFHGPIGNTATNLLILGAIVGISLLGVRRELHQRF